MDREQALTEEIESLRKTLKEKETQLELAKSSGTTATLNRLYREVNLAHLVDYRKKKDLLLQIAVTEHRFFSGYAHAREEVWSLLSVRNAEVDAFCRGFEEGLVHSDTSTDAGQEETSFEKCRKWCASQQ